MIRTGETVLIEARVVDPHTDDCGEVAVCVGGTILRLNPDHLRGSIIIDEEKLMTPTVGRIVHYIQGDLELVQREVGSGGTNGTRVHPAIITRVWSDTCVNLHVFLDGVASEIRSSVTHLDTPPDVHNPNSGWRWPPRD